MGGQEKNAGTVPVNQEPEFSSVSLLEKVRKQGKVWEDLAQKYGVDNPDPPWKINLDSTCEALSAEQCALPVLERRNEEDVLSESLYQDVPYPERQLLALTHSMIERGLIDEDELALRMKFVSKRLNST
ncbi:MAG: nitrile hydratase subunit beta [Proteobacteria bacterium]|nr:nitrile hydratase subunit beta [Pseudomonadota bacterium]